MHVILNFGITTLLIKLLEEQEHHLYNRHVKRQHYRMNTRTKGPKATRTGSPRGTGEITRIVPRGHEPFGHATISR
jgi:hypothetical protein